MFCDLVGSTALSTGMDPEDLRDVIASYQSRCSAVIRHYDGFVAKYMGDGILVYFGYPRAHEDEAERSVRAGLDIVDAMAELNVAIRRPQGVELAVRIGIATGPVIVGDQIGEGTASETAVVGETPNLAARLQALAQPNQIVASAATRAMLGDHFDLEDLGAYELKGFAGPAPAWRVLSARDVESRFAATRTGSSAPLVGRPSTRRDLPSPASPWISTTWPRPRLLPSQARNSSPISSWRPTSGAALPSRVAANRLSTSRADKTRQTGTGSANPFSS